MIHNVGLGYREPRRIQTEVGLPHVFAIDTLAPYLLTALIQRPKRLIYLSSALHRSGDISLEDFTWERRPWQGAAAYLIRSSMLGGLTSLSGVQSEADLHCHLPVSNLVILEVAVHLGDLKPPHISDRLASSRDRVVHCVFDAVWRGTDQLNLLVNVVAHKRIKPLHVVSGERIPSEAAPQTGEM